MLLADRNSLCSCAREIVTDAALLNNNICIIEFSRTVIINVYQILCDIGTIGVP